MLGLFCGASGSPRWSTGLVVASVILAACNPSRSDENAQPEPVGPRADLLEHPSAQPSSISPQAAKWRGLFRTPDHLPNTPPYFCKAKGRAMQVNLPHGRTFYCGCEFTANMKFSADRCGYRPHQHSHRSERVEWEHVVPVVTMMAHRPCSTQELCTDEDGKKYTGIKCCEEIDTKFVKMETDLQNIFPVVGELNGARANHEFGEIPGEPRAFGKCDFETDRERKITEPPPSVRGDIARVYL
jgi:endonuclease I